jgi:sulfotransferase
MFSAETGDNVYTRAEHTLKKGLLAATLQALRQAWYGEQAHRLIAIPYDSLTTQPAEVIGRLYELLGQPLFPHDFDNLEYAKTTAAFGMFPAKIRAA